MNNTKQKMMRPVLWFGVLLLSLGDLHAQNLINVKPATGALTAPTGPAVVGTGPGDTWNAFGNLPGTGGTLTNATTIKDSSGATLSGVTMTLSINGASLSGFSSSAFGANPTAIMSSHIYDGPGDYFTIVFSGLPASKAYMLYGLSTRQRGSTGFDLVGGCREWSWNRHRHRKFHHRQPAWDARCHPVYQSRRVRWVKIPRDDDCCGSTNFSSRQVERHRERDWRQWPRLL